MKIEETEVTAKKYALKILGLNESQIMNDEIERKIENIAQNFIAGAKWFESSQRGQQPTCDLPICWINTLPKAEFLRLVRLAIKRKGEVSLIKKMYEIVEQEREAKKKMI